MNMDIELDYELTNKIRGKIWQSRSQWSKEFHRSDLVWCPLKTYCRLTGIEGKPIPSVVERWVVGEIGHTLIQKAFKLTEVYKTFEGAEVHYDILWNQLPLEVKTTVISILNKSQIPHEYLDQLAFGLVFNQSREGLLLTLDIINKVLLVWRVNLTEEELAAYTGRFIKQKQEVLQAVKEKNPSQLIPKREECHGCQYAYREGCPAWK